METNSACFTVNDYKEFACVYKLTAECVIVIAHARMLKCLSLRKVLGHIGRIDKARLRRGPVPWETTEHLSSIQTDAPARAEAVSHQLLVVHTVTDHVAQVLRDSCTEKHTHT